LSHSEGDILLLTVLMVCCGKRIHLSGMNSHCMGTRYYVTTSEWDWRVYNTVWLFIKIFIWQPCLSVKSISIMS